MKQLYERGEPEDLQNSTDDNTEEVLLSVLAGDKASGFDTCLEPRPAALLTHYVTWLNFGSATP